MDNSSPRRSLDGVNRPPRRRPQPSTPARVREPLAQTSGLPPLPAPEISSQPATGAKGWRRFFTRKRLTVGAAGFFGVLLIGGAILSWFLYKDLLVASIDTGAVALQDQVDPSLLKGEGDGRVNLLLIGIDDAAGLSDTMMLVSLDPIAKDVAMLSIPRDLYVDIEGFGSAKINAAHAYGEQYEYQGGGPQLLSDTLERILDVPIHYYARVNFEGFKQAIDIVGGVKVEVEEDLIDYNYPDANGGYDPFQITAGVHQLDGPTALKYARSRYSTSDFDRSRRQQQVLLALKEKSLSLGTLSNPARVTNLLRTLSKNAQTNLSLNEIMRLVELTEGIKEDNVVRAQLDASEDNFLSFSNMYGQSVLVPTSGDFTQIQEYVRGLLVDSYIKDEAASISILNGTEAAGLANETASLLRSFGYRVDNIDNASEQNYTQTVIFDYTGQNPYTLRYLEQRFGVTAQRRQPPKDRPDIEIEIVIGSNYDATAR